MAQYTESESSTLDFNFTSQSVYTENESSTLDLELAKTTARATFDSVIENRDIDRTATFDAVLKNFDIEKDLTIDAAVVQKNSLDYNIDAAIENRDQEVTFTADAIIEDVDKRTFGFDTIIVDTFTQDYSVDAAISKELETSQTVDAAIKNRDVDLNASTDAAIQEQDLDVTYTTDAVLINQEDNTATFDTVVAFGREGNFTAIIDGNSYTGVTNVEIETHLNELHTFKFDAFIEDDADRQSIQEGNEVLLFDGTKLVFKGELENVNYDSTFEAECEGSGQKLPLLKSKTPRKEYINQPADDIIRDLLGGNDAFVLDTVEAAPVITIRVDHDNQLRAAAGVANAVGYDLYAENRITDDYETTYVNFVQHKGSESSVATLNIAEELRLVDRGKDNSVVANDITILGRGDGINQKEVRLFAATTHRTVTTQRIQAGDGTTLDVDDATQLGATGDEIYVRVGEEVIHANIQDGTTLDILGRGQQDYKGDSTEDGQHYEDIQVFLQENVTQSIGPFEPTRDLAEDGSSIERFGNVEERQTDKTLIDRATVEKVADNELKDRREPVFRVEVDLTDPRGLNDLGIEIGDQVTIEDLTAPDVSNDFRVVGIDYKRASAGEATTLHCANRPVRLVERLSEIERDRDTLNAHMQGATNFNGESFSDNCDSNHPLSNKVFVPNDVVEINKFELTFHRESFRGYTESTEEESTHTHDFSVTHPQHSHEVEIPAHDHSVTVSHPEHSHDVDLSDVYITFKTRESILADFSMSVLGDTNDNLEITGSPDELETGGIVTGSAGGAHTHDWPADTSAGEGDIEINYRDIAGKIVWPSDSALGTLQMKVDIFEDLSGSITTSDNALGTSTSETTTDGGASTETSDTALGTTDETTTDTGSSHNHGVNYGIFEPTNESDVDVEVKVDGNTVTTITDVSVGQEVTDTIDLKNDLSDPVTGEYHKVELVPTGRCRLSADVVQKVFIESKL